MCKDPSQHAFLHALPKCEHHVHIEGTLMPDTLFALLARNKLQPPADDPAFASKEALLARYDRFTSLDDFLHYYYAASAALIHAADFEELAWAYFARVAADGVVHAEISFDPQAHMERGVAFGTVVEGFTAARVRAREEFGMSTELICCFLRHLPQVAALELMRSEEFKGMAADKTIVGIGLDSSEVGFPPELFAEVYGVARTLGLRLTAHAGEEGPAANVETVIKRLGVERVDHGIHLADDPALMREVGKMPVMLTVCPLSNLRLRCVQSLDQLPIRAFLDAGVKFSVNSDDPSYFGGFLLDNYCALQEAFGLSREEFVGICRTGIVGSWCSEERKKALLGKLEMVAGQA